MSERPNVVVLDELFASAQQAVQGKFPAMSIAVVRGNDNREGLVATANVLVAQNETVNRELLDAAGDLRLLLKMGRLYDNIDVEAARRRNLPMAISPRKGPSCVAELALTMILALSKQLTKSHRHVANGDYRQLGLEPVKTAEKRYAFKWMKQNIQEIGRKTLGIVGLGEIGCELARRARAMGMQVLYFKRNPLSPELEQRYGIRYNDLHPMLEASDYVCVAAPHTPSTEHMLGADELRLIGPQGFLVNISRGSVVDENALVNALKNGDVAGAGLDVFTYEPLPYDSPLCTLDNVILTPHIGGGSGSNAALELAEALVEVESILAGNPPGEPL